MQSHPTRATDSAPPLVPHARDRRDTPLGEVPFGVRLLSILAVIVSASWVLHGAVAFPSAGPDPVSWSLALAGIVLGVLGILLGAALHRGSPRAAGVLIGVVLLLLAAYLLGVEWRDPRTAPLEFVLFLANCAVYVVIVVYLLRVRRPLRDMAQRREARAARRAQRASRQ